MSLPYQNPNVTQSDVRQAVRNCKFIRALYSDDTFWIKEELEMAVGRPYKHIRLTKIREEDNWSGRIDEIIDRLVREKQEKHGSFGSLRGFMTFTYQALCEEVLKEIIIRIWAPAALRRFAHMWLDRHYKPGGKGFREVAENTKVGKKTT